MPATATSVYFELMATAKSPAVVKQLSSSSSPSVQPLWLKDVDKVKRWKIVHKHVKCIINDVI